MKIKNKMKQGAASFYVVAFSTLILLIVVASFTALVVAQITRSSNDDLAQSAYDSALAGVEDAKLAYYNYQSCVAQGIDKASGVNNDGNLTCGEIIYMVEEVDNDCDVVAKILGRDIGEYGVAISEGNKDNNMQQSYTCAIIEGELPDYRASLSVANPLKVINVKLDGASADSIEKVKVSWGSDMNSTKVKLSNFSSGKVTFPKINSNSSDIANPPTIAVALVQAGEGFKMEDFDKVENGQTNRGMVYLTPVTKTAQSTSGSAQNYNGTTFGKDDGADMELNKINASSLVDSNNTSRSNLPYGVSCPYADSSEFACVTMINLPKPIGGVRSDDNFVIAVSLPYGASTDFMLEFFCADSATSCGTVREENKSDLPASQARLKGLQIGIDSTGRANDLYRRVEARLEGADDFAISLMGPLELLGDGTSGSGGVGLEKDYAVVCEYDFDPTCSR